MFKKSHLITSAALSILFASSAVALPVKKLSIEKNGRSIRVNAFETLYDTLPRKIDVLDSWQVACVNQQLVAIADALAKTPQANMSRKGISEIVVTLHDQSWANEPNLIAEGGPSASGAGVEITISYTRKDSKTSPICVTATAGSLIRDFWAVKNADVVEAAEAVKNARRALDALVRGNGDRSASDVAVKNVFKGKRHAAVRADEPDAQHAGEHWVNGRRVN